MSAAAGRRRAGLLIPLFSCTSSASWGIGDIADVEPATAWLASAGLRVLQLLPLNEMAPGQQSPYSAISAIAPDPIFIHLPWVPEFEALGGAGAAVDRVAGRAAAPRARGDRSRAPRARRRSALSAVPAVDGRHAVDGRARPRAQKRRAAVRRSAVHGRRRQRRCVGAAASVP